MKRKSSALGRGLWVLALVWLGWGGQAVSAVARLRSPATVAGPDILLGEIADIDSSDEQLRQRLEGLVVGKAALPGAERQLFVGSVRVRLRQAGIAETAVTLEAEGDPLRVQTAATQIPATELEATAQAAVARWLEETYGVAAESISAVVSTAAPPVAGEKYALRAGEVSRKPGSTLLSVPVSIWSAGRLVGQVAVDCSSATEVEVAVAASKLARHSRLISDGVRWERRPVLSVPPGAVGREAGHEGVDWRLTRPVEAGTVLTWELLERSPAARAGDEVQLISAAGVVRVADVGRLATDGWLGERVAVRNARTGQTVYGTLVTPTLVEVRGSEQASR